MKLLENFWREIKRGENVELYVTIVLAFGLVLLNVLGVHISEGLAESLTLTVLGLLAVSALVNRRRLEQLPKKLLRNAEGNLIIHATLPRNILDQKFAGARSEIWILDTWFSRPDAVPDSLLAAAQRGVHVKILFLDKDAKTPILKLRMKDLGYTPTAAAQTSRDTLQRMINQTANAAAAIEIRLYQALPPFNLYRVDDVLYLGFFWYKKLSYQGAFLEVKSVSSPLAVDVKEAFQKLWDDAHPFSA